MTNTNPLNKYHSDVTHFGGATKYELPHMTSVVRRHMKRKYFHNIGLALGTVW